MGVRKTQGEGGVAQDPGQGAGLASVPWRTNLQDLRQSGCGHRDGEFQADPSLASPLPVSGRTDEAESLPSTAHQLHTQNCENHQVSWLGASLPRATPSHPGPGARRSEDFHPPLLCVSRVLPSVYISGDIILASLLRGVWERAGLGWTACASSIAA